VGLRTLPVMAESEVIPLFPLGSVLYPGLLLPLNVFEPRYRRLVQDLLARPEEQRTFGVVAIRQGREVGADGITALHAVGCAAQLRRVEEQDDGRFHLVTTGGPRFTLGRLDDSSHPYLQAEVTWLPEEAGASEPEVGALAERVATGFRGYLAALATARGNELEVPQLPTDPGVLSYLVAAAVVADLADKQALLAAPSVVSRLASERSLLARERALITALPTAPATELTRVPWSPN